ncbi:MAG: hypothetical protein GX295_01960 [Syntrophomonadaceae bacterium]|nr:hypothetical protein [Syntrophomonadaceae bacterium]
MTNKYSNRIYIHEKFWIAFCSFPSEKNQFTTEYVVLKPGRNNYAQVETFNAMSKVEAIHKGVALARKHGLYP